MHNMVEIKLLTDVTIAGLFLLAFASQWSGVEIG